MTYLLKAVGALAATAAIGLIVAALAGASTTKTGRTTVAVAKSRLGSILVDGKGITLYDFVQDKGTMSTCYSACAALWPPLLTTGKPIAGPGVRASLLGTTKRKDGKLEVTYKGHPLYYFVTDRKPGQTTGQGLNQFGAPWWVLSRPGRRSIVSSASSHTSHQHRVNTGGRRARALPGRPGRGTDVAGYVTRYVGAVSGS